MKDFECMHIETVRDGHSNIPMSATVYVYSDSKKCYYDILPSEKDDFENWVKATFTGEEDSIMGYQINWLNLYTIGKVAVALQVSKNSIYLALRVGRVKAIKIPSLRYNRIYMNQGAVWELRSGFRMN